MPDYVGPVEWVRYICPFCDWGVVEPPGTFNAQNVTELIDQHNLEHVSSMISETQRK